MMNSILRVTAILALAVTTGALQAQGQAPEQAKKQAAAAGKQSAVAAEGRSPEELIAAVAETLIQRIKDNQEELNQSPDKLFQMVDEVVLPHFDFPLMSRLVLGKHWATASEEQQQRFQESFKTLLVKTYGNALLQYSDQKVEFSPAEMGSKPDRASVESTITTPGSDPVSMQYRMRKLDDRWLVYDVVVDNISLVTNYRGTYASEVQRNGLDSLIAKLEQQTAS